jgi:hypothetical protein
MAEEPNEKKAQSKPRTPRSVINEAIRETEPYDKLCWWGLVLFGLTGTLTILAGVLQGNAGIGAVGAVSAALCWPAMNAAISIRRGNVSLRLLELALNNVATADQALTAINRAFGTHFGDGEVKKNVVPKPKSTAPRGSA